MRAMRSLLRSVVVGGTLLAAVTSPVLAQGVIGPPAGAMLPKPNIKGVKYHVSLMVSGGFDMDLFGDFVEGQLGLHDGHQLAIREPRPWPDVYVKVPRRRQATVGFGVFKKDEIIARVSKADYTATPMTDAGSYAGDTANEPMTLAVSPYHERSLEFGWRHYLVMTPRVKQFANIVFGHRTIQPISGVLSIPEGTLGTVRLYDRSRVKTFSLEIGLSVEAAHMGVFVNSGIRWSHRLSRNDTDLIDFGLTKINNSGPRIYMPLQFGLLFRL